MPEFAAIVLSAGRGSRMRSDIPKQYMDLLGKPVIYYSLKAFQDSPVSEIVLVTSEADREYCRREIVEKYALTKVKAIVSGGAERYDSVLEGLRAIQGADYVLIHDGARPMLDQEIVARSIETVISEKACVVGMPVKDTIKVINDQGYAANTPDRRYLWMVQTPQSFEYRLIREAYEQMRSDMLSGKDMPAITDDAMVAEYEAGISVKLIPGSYENIKITTPEDLEIAALHLHHRAEEKV